MTLPLFFYPACGTDEEPIQFSDEHNGSARCPGWKTPATSSSKKPEKQKLSKEEFFQGGSDRLPVLAASSISGITANELTVFLQGDDDEVDALIKEFPDHVPPIKESYQADLRPNRTPVDKETGKPAQMILSVETLDPVR